jgi:peptide/nickel transport system permease protein
VIVPFGGRLVLAVPTLVVLSLLSFSLAALSPIDSARMALTGGSTAVQVDDAALQAKRAELGLDRSLPERYGRWLAGVARFDLGSSYTSGRPVTELLGERIPASVALGFAALLLAILLAVPLATTAAMGAGSWLDLGTRAIAVGGASLPGFWLALLLIWLFAVQLRVLPALGSLTPTGIILPAVVLALRPMARLLRLLRAELLEVRSREFAKVAAAKGLSPAAVLGHHLLPNAVGPVLTLIGLDLISLLANAVLIEWVFAWPGVGRLGAQAALAGDVPVLSGVILVTGLAAIVTNLGVDMLCAALDPRFRVA